MKAANQLTNEIKAFAQNQELDIFGIADVEHFGSRICVGYLVSNAPLMGGDYRYPDFDQNQCGDCQICIEACPAGALTEGGCKTMPGLP